MCFHCSRLRKALCKDGSLHLVFVCYSTLTNKKKHYSIHFLQGNIKKALLSEVPLFLTFFHSYSIHWFLIFITVVDLPTEKSGLVKLIQL